MSRLAARVRSAFGRWADAWRRRRRGRRRALRAARRYGVPRGRRDAATRAYVAEIAAFWKAHSGRAVDPTWHLAFERLTGVRDVRFVPGHEWWESILPFLNERGMRHTYRDKSLSRHLLRLEAAPAPVLERIRGRYFAEGAPLSPAAAAERIEAGPRQVVVKPSRADNGRGVAVFEVAGAELLEGGRPHSLAALAERYGDDFVVQERVRQHPRLAAVHPASVNTVRLVTLRWGCAIRVLLSFARFGTGGRVTDNAGSGGLCCHLDETGRLAGFAVDRRGRVHTMHPDTGFAFAERFSIPGWEAFPREALRLHEQVFHFDLVGWDFAVGESAEPVFLEMNFQGVADVYQLTSRRPLFGDLTAELLEAVRAGRARGGEGA